MNKLSIRLKYHHDTGKYPVEGRENSLTEVFNAPETEFIDKTGSGDPEQVEIENTLYPYLKYIDWLEEQLTKY